MSLRSALIPDPLVMGAECPADSALEAWHQFSTSQQPLPGSDCLVVLRGDQVVVGLLQPTDLLPILIRSQALQDVTLGELAPPPPLICQLEDLRDPAHALTLLTEYRLSGLPIVDPQHRFLGLITRTSLEQLPVGGHHLDAEAVADLPIGLFCTDLQGCLTYLNPRCQEKTGLDPATALGSPWVEMVHPQDREQVLADLAHSQQQQKVWEGEFRIQRPDQSVIWVQGRTSFTPSALEQRFTLINIDGHKHSELALTTLNQHLETRIAEGTQALQERQAELQDFFDEANELIYRVNLQTGQLEYANQYWRDVLGYGVADVSCLTLFDVLHPDYHASARLLLASPTVTPKGIELIFRTYDQQDMVAEGSCRYVWQGDQPVGLRCILRNVTERKTAERLQLSLLQELQGFKTALDQSASVIMTDCNGTILYANEQMCQSSGYTVAELVGHSCDLIDSDQHPPTFYQDMVDTIHQGLVWQGEIANRSKSGDLYWEHVTIVPLLNSQQVPYQFLRAHRIIGRKLETCRGQCWLRQKISACTGQTDYRSYR